MRLFSLFFMLALPAFAAPQTSDMDLRNTQFTLQVGANGSSDIKTLHCAMVLNSGALTQVGFTVLSSAGTVHGALTSTSCDFDASGSAIKFDATSSGDITVNGATGGDSFGGEFINPAPSVTLTEGGSFVSSGIINGGSTGNTDGIGAPGTGGDGIVILDGTKSSWNHITFNPGASTWYAIAGGNADLILHSTQTSATLYITADNANNSGGSTPASVSNITVAGASLTSLTLANYSCTAGIFGTHDYSGAALGSLSVDALLVTYSASYGGNSPTSGALNLSGLCATPSATGSDAAVVLASNGVNISTN